MTSDPAGRAGSEWTLDTDGRYVRRGARVLLLDGTGRILMVRAHDVDDPGRSWWFTVGGGIKVGEDARSAAVREAREEVGARLDPGQLVGPVWRRSAVFDFAREHCRQDEEFFVATIDASSVAVDRERWTAIELDTVDEVRWWDLDDLAAVDIQVYPEGLVDLLRDLARGWDGVTRTLGRGGRAESGSP